MSPGRTASLQGLEVLKHHQHVCIKRTLHLKRLAKAAINGNQLDNTELLLFISNLGIKCAKNYNDCEVQDTDVTGSMSLWTNTSDLII